MLIDFGGNGAAKETEHLGLGLLSYDSAETETPLLLSLPPEWNQGSPGFLEMPKRSLIKPPGSGNCFGSSSVRFLISAIFFRYRNLSLL